MKNAKLAFGLSDAALGELHRQIEDKAERLGGLGLWAPRFFPASKRCSACGDVMAERDLSVREWNCPSCGVSHDRDSNAATNPLWLAELAMTADEAAALAAAGRGESESSRRIAPRPEPSISLR